MRIQIPNPCTENWQQMSPKEQGRHCEKCSKTVVDFRTMTDREIVNHMKAHPGSCGKFYNTQLERDLTKNIIPEKSNHWVNALGAMSLLSAQMISSDIKAQNIIENLESKLADTTSTNFKCFSVFSNVFKFRITNTEDSLYRIEKIKVELDTFSITFDSLTSQEYSFHMPLDLNYDSVKITLIGNDTFSTVLFVPKNIFLSSFPYYMPTIHLYKDSASWKFVSEIPYYNSPIQYEVMGIPPLINYFDTGIIYKIYDVNVFQPIAFPVSDTLKDSAKMPLDTPKIEIKKEEIKIPVEPENKLNLFWKFLFFIGLGSAVYFVSRKLRGRV